MTVTATTLDAALKELYAGQTISNLVYDHKSRPFFSMLAKKKMSGRKMPLPVVAEDVGGRSQNFTNAQTNVAASAIEAFEIDVKKDYAIARIESEAILRAEDDKGAFIRGLKHTVDSALNRLANNQEIRLFASNTGSIGTISSISSDVITLTDIENVTRYWVGQVLVFAASAAAALRDSGTTATVTVVDRDLGTVTIDATPTGVVANDLIFEQGDYTAANDQLMLSGLPDWLPAAAPGATAFFGVDRSVDATRYGGVRYAGSTADIIGSIYGAAARLGREGAAPDVALMSFDTFRGLSNEMDAKAERSASGSAEAGYQRLTIIGPKGPIECVPCTQCENGLVWLLTKKTWAFYHLGKEPVFLNEFDGLKVRAVSNADAFEARVMCFPQLGCTMPGHNSRVTLS